MNRFALALSLLSALLAAPVPGTAQKLIADTVILNGKVFTGDTAHPHAEAIAIRGERILAVGANQEIAVLAGPRTKRVDAAGRLVIPGIMDTHIHYTAGAAPTVTNIDFPDRSPTCQQVLDTLAKKVNDVPSGILLFGFMGTDAFFDSACTPVALDRIAPHTAVFLAAGTVHAGMLNKAAEKWFGIDTSAPPPLAGWYGKDTKSKTWDGVVHNSAMLPLFVKTSSEGFNDDASLRKYFHDEARWGVTSNTFLEYNAAARVAQLARVNAPFRIRVVPFAQYETGSSRRRLRQVTVPATIADRVTSHGEKWVLDGTPMERSAPMRQPYADDPTTSGQLDYPDAEVRGILTEALQHNLPLMLHVTGDRSAEQLFDQMEATGGPAVWAKQRVRIEHGDAVMADLIPRAKALGVIIARNPMYLLGDQQAKRVGPQRAALWSPGKSLLDAGVPVVLATDGAPGLPFNNPFLGIQIASTYPTNPREALTREQAFTAYTRTAAYSEFSEDRLGTLGPGKLADLAILSQDIFTVPTQDLPKTESILTLVCGKVAYSRDPKH